VSGDSWKILLWFFFLCLRVFSEGSSAGLFQNRCPRFSGIPKDSLLVLERLFWVVVHSSGVPAPFKLLKILLGDYVRMLEECFKTRSIAPPMDLIIESLIYLVEFLTRFNVNRHCVMNIKQSHFTFNLWLKSFKLMLMEFILHDRCFIIQTA